MSVSEWKTVHLLGLSLCIDGQKLQQHIKAAITATCNSKTKKVIADEQGLVHVFSDKWEPITFKASRTGAIKLCALSSDNSLLVTLEQPDDNGKYENFYLQVFNLNGLRKRDGAPCVAFGTFKAASAVTAVEISLIGNTACIAMGFERGNMIFYRSPNNLFNNRDISGNFRSMSVTVSAITGIQFRQRTIGTWSMFVCSNSGIFCYTLLEGSISTDIGDTKCVLDSTNAPSNCCAFGFGEVDESYFTVGCEDAIYCFTSDGRGPCYALEGRKEHLAWYGNNLVVAMQSRNPAFKSDESRLIVVDVPNKIIVFSKEMDSIAAIIVEKSYCYILTKTKKQVFLLDDRDMQFKVQTLLQKKLYAIALRLLEGNGNSTLKAEVNMQYGDNLLQRGNPQEAVEKYIKTIGTVQPFQVIRKLMDTRYNRYLTSYLRALAQTEHRTEDHLELLQGCLEREGLPQKVKDIFQGQNTTTHSEQFDMTVTGCFEDNGLTAAEYLTHIDDLDRACTMLSAWNDEEKLYGFVSGIWEKTGSTHSEQLTEILKRICSSSDHSMQLAERFLPLIMLHDTAYALDFVKCIIEHRNEDETFKLRSTLLNLSLREWSSGRKSSSEVVAVLEENMPYLSVEHALLVCRDYAFWDGILHLSKHPKQQYTDRACLRYLKDNVKFAKFLEIGKEYENWNADIWLQLLHQHEGLADGGSPKMFNSIFSTMLQGSKKNLVLEVLRNISGNQKLTVAHMKDVFNSSSLRNRNTIEYESQIDQIKSYQGHLEQLKALVGKFSKNSMEFRSSVCDMCKQPLTFPILHFLCQHSYHKECVAAHSENQACISCSMTKNNILGLIDVRSQAALATASLSQALAETNKDIIEHISIFLRGGVFQPDRNDSKPIATNPFEDNSVVNPSVTASPNQPSRWFKHNAIVENKGTTSTNPFGEEEELAKEYDANLNPFSE